MQVETIVLAAIALAILGILRRVGAVGQGVEELLKIQGLRQGTVEPSNEVRTLAVAGKMVEAMRMYRKQCGADVRQAKRVVDLLADPASALAH